MVASKSLAVATRVDAVILVPLTSPVAMVGPAWQPGRRGPSRSY
jgi:hypothetical protein